MDDSHNSSDAESGILDGWRQIAADIMQGLDHSDHEATPCNDTLTQPSRPTEEIAVGNADQQNGKELSEISETRVDRMKSVVAKKGENFYMDYQIIEEIGSGAFGRALKAKRKSDLEMVVVKELIGTKMTEQEIADAKNEVKILAHLNHSNIVRYHDFYSDNGKMHIIMEYCERGDLAKHLQSRNDVLLEENEILMKFVQICLALEHTHSQGVIHRDLKSQNIFLTTNGILKLGDFGIAKILTEKDSMEQTMAGTPCNMSPEICDGKPYGVKNDIWALGCVLYELCTLKHAFHQDSFPDTLLRIKSGEIPEIPTKYSSHLSSLQRRLLCRDPEKRPSCQEILNFEYIRLHLQHYAAHIHFSVFRRQESFKRALEPFHLTDDYDRMTLCRQETVDSFLDGPQRQSTLVLSRMHTAGLEQWDEIDDDDDVIDLDITPYQFYAKDDQYDNGQSQLQRTRTISGPIMPFTAECRSNLSKIDAVRRRIFSEIDCSVRHSNRTQKISTIHEEDDEDEASVAKYDSEGESDQASSVTMESDDDSIDQSRLVAQASLVVDQISKIMKTPSMHMGLALEAE